MENILSDTGNPLHPTASLFIVGLDKEDALKTFDDDTGLYTPFTNYELARWVAVEGGKEVYSVKITIDVASVSSPHVDLDNEVWGW